MLNIRSLKHEKESLYLTISAIVGVLLWIIIIIVSIGTIFIYGIIMAFGLWITQQYFKAVIYGNSVKVSESQYQEINGIIVDYCKELGLIIAPDVFIVNGQGTVNAVAVKFLSKKYVILYSDLVDLMLKRKEINELKMIIAHELAHHAAGHINIGKNLLIGPATFIPFLGPAYSRACELTADRIAHKLTNDHEASMRALISLANGSESLASSINIESFKNQEAQIPPFFGFLHEIFGTHPRMTKRIIELEKLN
jgi:Zn-dependent protease with chaperone function